MSSAFHRHLLTPALSLCAAFAILLTLIGIPYSISAAYARTSDQPASLVLSHPNVTSSGGVNRMYAPTNVPVVGDGRLAVADSNSHVLLLANTTAVSVRVSPPSVAEN